MLRVPSRRGGCGMRGVRYAMTAVLALVVGAPLCSAQARFELTPFIGGYGATENAISQQLAICSDVCWTMKQDDALVLGVAFREHFNSHWALEAAIGYASSGAAYGEMCDGSCNNEVLGSLVLTSVRLEFSTPAARHAAYFVALGPAVVFSQGYDSILNPYAPTGGVGLGNPTSFGGVAALGAGFRLGIPLRFELADYLYRLTYNDFPASAGGQPVNGKMQQDFVLSVGVPITVGKAKAD